jgi:hypothetical protein
MDLRPAWDVGVKHVRRYPALYVIGVAWLVMLLIVPSVIPKASSGATDTTDTQQVTAAGGTAASNVPGAHGSTKASVSGPGVQSAGGPSSSLPVAKVVVGRGITRAGYACAPGVRQVPWSAYAPPCEAKYIGYNGGATYTGVTDKAIKIGVRVTVDDGGPASKTSDQLQQKAGNATLSQAFDYASKLVTWFNNHYELYGRHVELVKYNGKGNSIDEAQNKGQEAACADATTLATSVKAFAGVQYGFQEESGVFTDCAALRHHTFMPLTAPYFPENHFQQWHPYAWDNSMQCERIARDLAEYVGKRLYNRNAKWAGDATLRASKRRFGLYVPNDPNYLHCVQIFEDNLKRDYGGSVALTQDYPLDVSQFPSSALNAIVKFNADHDTTIILACDGISPSFLTQGADQQGYHPEWEIIGVAGTDTDSTAASWDQSEVKGHLFGMSEIGDFSKLMSPTGEAARAWYEASGQKTLPNTGPMSEYYNLVDIFSLLQAAGPILTPANAAKGIRLYPTGGGAAAPNGTWSFAHDHTATIDEREIYWDGSHYKQTYGGKRFQSGQWPSGDPPIYPNGS